MNEINFGSNSDAAAPSRGKGKQAENFGIITVELPNGQRVDGYILLSAKNAAKLGLSKEKLAELVKTSAKAEIAGGKLHVQFGERDLTVADAVEMTFA